jgi:hypothetical protein
MASARVWPIHFLNFARMSVWAPGSSLRAPPSRALALALIPIYPTESKPQVPLPQAKLPRAL